jgi:hypothetical protein
VLLSRKVRGKVTFELGCDVRRTAGLGAAAAAYFTIGNLLVTDDAGVDLGGHYVRCRTS